MTQEDLLKKVAESLEHAGIPFMVAGSTASSYYGQPRSTHDIDLVIDPAPAQLEQWLLLLGDQFYFDAAAARAALRQRSMFNIIDLAGGWKVDLIIRKNRPFSIEEFNRRKTGYLPGQALPFASAEDIILTKLEWNRITPSERQVHDALNVALTQWPNLDQPYLRKWAPALGIEEQLETVLRAAEEAQQPTKPE